jgi:hypothetical protein
MGRISDVLRRSTAGYLHYCDGCDSWHLINVDVPNEYTGARWTFDGNVDAPTFSPSVNIVGKCHYFITKGMIQYCSDSKHRLAGKTVPLPKIREQDEWAPD